MTASARPPPPPQAPTDSGLRIRSMVSAAYRQCVHHPYMRSKSCTLPTTGDGDVDQSADALMAALPGGHRKSTACEDASSSQAASSYAPSGPMVEIGAPEVICTHLLRTRSPWPAPAITRLRALCPLSPASAYPHGLIGCCLLTSGHPHDERRLLRRLTGGRDAYKPRQGRNGHSSGSHRALCCLGRTWGGWRIRLRLQFKVKAVG